MTRRSLMATAALILAWPGLAPAQGRAGRMAPVPAGQVVLKPSIFSQAQDANSAYLHSLSSQRLLHNFHKAAGLEPQGAIYGGKAVFEQLRHGDIRATTFSLNDGWAPIYTWHKVHAGLLAAHSLAGTPGALDVAVGMAGYLATILDGLSDDQVQEILIAEHGGINEAYAETYALTGDRRWLDVARRLRHRAVLDPLAVGQRGVVLLDGAPLGDVAFPGERRDGSQAFDLPIPAGVAPARITLKAKGGNLTVYEVLTLARPGGPA